MKTEKRASANTVSSYLRDMRQFEAAMSSQDTELEEVLTQDVERYAASLTRKGKSAATVIRSIASIKSFYSCLIALGIVDHNPAKGVVAAKVERKLPQILTGKEVELFLEQPDSTDLKGCRDRAMLELLYATGIRVSELIALDVDDLNLPAGVLRCVSKGKERIIPLYSTAVRALNEYLHQVRPQLVESPEETALFVNMNGERMSRQGFWKLIKFYQEKAGTRYLRVPLLRRPPAGERGRPALHPGHAGPRGYLLHPDLLPASQSEDQGRVPEKPPPGLRGFVLIFILNDAALGPERWSGGGFGSLFSRGISRPFWDRVCWMRRDFAAPAARYFPIAGKVPKGSPGDGSGWTLRVHIRLTPGPPLRGTRTCRREQNFRRAKSEWLV